MAGVRLNWSFCTYTSKNAVLLMRIEFSAQRNFCYGICNPRDILKLIIKWATKK